MKSPALAHHRVFIWIVTLVIVDSCLASPTRTLGDQDRLIDIAEKVDVIDNKLDRLTSEHDEHSLLERIDQKLVRIDQKLETLALVHGTMATVTLEKPDDGPQKPRPESGGEQREFPYFNCVNLLSVERSPTSNGNRFTLKFTKNVEDVSYSYHDGTGQLKPVADSVVEEGDGVLSVSFTCESRGEPMPVWFVFSDKVEEEGWSFMESRHTLHLSLNNSGSDETSQRVDSLPELHVDPPRALIYEPGQDVNATAFIHASDYARERLHIFESVTGINMSNGEISMEMRKDIIPDNHFMDEEFDTSLEDVTKTVTLMTSSTAVSGYLIFGVSLQMEGPLVLRVQVNRVIELRPSNQTRLPSHYLGIINTPFLGKSGSGNELRECRAGEVCNISCYAAGEDISDMNVVKLLADGSQEAVPSAMMSNMFPGESFRTISWPFQAEKGSGDGDGLTSFQCSAFDESHDKEVSKVVDVLVLLDDGIDDERSNVTVSDDEMNPDIKYITFTCVVYGRPLPEVTFSGGTNYIFYMDSDKPDELIKTSQNEAKAIKTVTLDMAYLRKYNYGIYEDDESPYCGFHSRSTYEYIEHKFQLPDLGLED